MMNVDIPTSSDLQTLTEQRDDMSVSMYLPSSRVSRESDVARIGLKSLGREAVHQLGERGADIHRISKLEDLINGLVADNEFWRYQANSLAVFATPDHIRYFRLPNALEKQLQVADRFAFAQLLRAVTFPNAGYVLAISEGDARLVEVSADVPASTMVVPDLPEDVEPFTTQPLADRLPRMRAQGTLGDASAQRMFARRVNELVRDRLRGVALPLVLAATEPMASIYRSINTYPRLAEAVIDGNAGLLNDGELAERARPIFDGIYRDQLADWRRLFEERENHGRGTTDVASAARAATFGAVDSIMIDMTAAVEGTVDPDDGAVTFAQPGASGTYDVLGEIAARVIRANGRVLAVRPDDIPNGTPLAAILRYAV